MSVNNSDAGKASHTPYIPNIRDKTNAKKTMAAMPLDTDITKHSLAQPVALKNPDLTIFHAASGNPIL